MSSSPTARWDVFLSHNSVDKPRVRRLARALEARGVRVWFDEQAIPAGSSIPLAVEEGIEGSRTMMLCLSPSFLASEWTGAERSAMQFSDPQNRERSVLPVRLARCDLPKNLAHLKYVDYLRHSDGAIDEIVRALNLTGTIAAPIEHAVSRLLRELHETEKGGDARATFERARQARELAEAAKGDPSLSGPLLAQARYEYARALLFLGGDLNEVWEAASAAATTPGIEQDANVQVHALITKAEVASRTGQLRLADGAIAAAEKLLDAMHGCENERQALLQVRAEFEARRGRPREAIALFDEAAREFASQLAVATDSAEARQCQRGLAGCLNNKALLLRDVGDAESALRSLSQAVDWYAKSDSPIDEAVSRLSLAEGLFSSGQFQQGWEEADQATELCRKLDFERGLVECLEVRGRAFAAVGRLHEATSAFEEAIALAVAAVDYRHIMSFHWQLATLNTTLGSDNVGALRHLSLAHQAAVSAGDQLAASEIRLQQDGLSQDGSAGMQRDTVIATLKRELQREDVPARVAYLHARLGSEQRVTGDVAAARISFMRARQAFEELDDIPSVGKVLISAADVELADGKYAEPLRMLHEALATVAGRGVWDVEVNARLGLARLVLADGDPHLARKLLNEASVVASAQEMKPESEGIVAALKEVERILALHGVPKVSLSDLGQELAELFAKPFIDRSSMMRFWFYWRGPDLLANLRTDSRAIALIVGSEAEIVRSTWRDFGVLFDIATYASSKPFADGPLMIDLVQFPADWPIPGCVGFRPAVRFGTGDASSEKSL